jgi:hypothetical protein
MYSMYVFSLNFFLISNIHSFKVSLSLSQFAQQFVYLLKLLIVLRRRKKGLCTGRGEAVGLVS